MKSDNSFALQRVITSDVQLNRPSTRTTATVACTKEYRGAFFDVDYRIELMGTEREEWRIMTINNGGRNDLMRSKIGKVRPRSDAVCFGGGFDAFRHGAMSSTEYP